MHLCIGLVQLAYPTSQLQLAAGDTQAAIATYGEALQVRGSIPPALGGLGMRSCRLCGCVHSCVPCLTQASYANHHHFVLPSRPMMQATPDNGDVLAALGVLLLRWVAAPQGLEKIA
jgi:hypothetical protein